MEERNARECIFIFAPFLCHVQHNFANFSVIFGIILTIFVPNVVVSVSSVFSTLFLITYSMQCTTLANKQLCKLSESNRSENFEESVEKYVRIKRYKIKSALNSSKLWILSFKRKGNRDFITAVLFQPYDQCVLSDY